MGSFLCSAEEILKLGVLKHYRVAFCSPYPLSFSILFFFSLGTLVGMFPFPSIQKRQTYKGQRLWGWACVLACLCEDSVCKEQSKKEIGFPCVIDQVSPKSLVIRDSSRPSTLCHLAVTQHTQHTHTHQVSFYVLS